jgi:hypothetical protein
MPILDHFHAPLYPTHTWESFHMRWATVIADTLDRQLPQGYFAEVHTHLGPQVSADIAEFARTAEETPSDGNGSPVAVAVRAWAPPTATMVLPFVFPDDLEVRILDERDDARLVAVVELVSPRNKDRTEARQGFAGKVVAYLQRGIGVIVVDIVTSRQSNPHNDIVGLLRLGEAFEMRPEPTLAALAYRPMKRENQDQVETWAVPVQIGDALPVLPLALRGAGLIPLDLEATYTETRQRCRL